MVIRPQSTPTAPGEAKMNARGFAAWTKAKNAGESAYPQAARRQPPICLPAW
jgi:hypothetical protein